MFLRIGYPAPISALRFYLVYILSLTTSPILIVLSGNSCEHIQHHAILGEFGYRKILYYKGFPEQSTPVFMVSVCSSVKIKGRDCGTINGHDESSSVRPLMKDAREVLVR